MNKKFIGLICLIFLLAASVPLAAQKIKTENGVEIISNPKKPKPPKGVAVNLVMEEEVRFGESEDPDKSFSELSNYVVDDNGKLYVLDMKDKKIKVYDNDGSFLFSFGKEGQGPGELGGPSGIILSPDKTTLIIEDGATRRLAYFQPDGTFIKHRAFVERLGLVNILMDSNGNALGREIGMADQKAFFEIKKFDSELKPIFSLDKIDFPIPVPGSGVKINMMDMMALYQFDSMGNIFYTRNQEYEVKVYSPDGKHFRSIRKDFDMEKVTEEDIEEILNRIPNATGINMSEFFEFPKNFPPIQFFVFADTGQLIVRTWEKGKGEQEFYHDVFDREGKLLSRFVSKADIRVWQKGKIYSIEDNEDGFKVIIRYSARWE